MKTRVVSGSRLHFGLMQIPPAEPWPRNVAETRPRYFGGVGVMLEEPAVDVVVEPHSNWEFLGLETERAQKFARQVTTEPHRVNIVRCPSQHVGLGVGTQLGLAIATALTRGRIPPLELAKKVGRGRRSAIGIHGFEYGGFIVDAGKDRPDIISPLAAREPVPESWWFVVITPRIESTWSGEREFAAFQKLAAAGNADDHLMRRGAKRILRALRSADLQSFGAAIKEYNIRAGEMFRPVQGDCYSHSAVRSLVSELTALGFHGAGQSSWGPTVFGVTEDQQLAFETAKRIALEQSFYFSPIVTKARNNGADASVEP